MCGRYTLAGQDRQLAARFAAGDIDEGIGGSNAAPSERVPVITASAEPDKRCLEYMQWGWAVSWTPSLVINARSDKIKSSPAFRDSFQYRRCLVPAGGYYEWQRTPGQKKTGRKFHFTVKVGSIIAFAGIWKECMSPSGELVPCVAIITTEPNELVESVHDRMPAILRPEHEELWLTAAFQPDMLLSLLEPFPADRMMIEECDDVSPKAKINQTEAGTLSLFG